MKVAVERIKVVDSERIRADIGNLKPLEESIGKVGLINPLVIDENDTLVAGYRRLQACKNLGMKEVEVAVVDFGGDDLKKLDVEVAENFYRKDFTPEEILSTELRRRQIEESRRQKGFFERLWLWIKSLFAPSASGREKPGRQEQKADEPEQGEEGRGNRESEEQKPQANRQAEAVDDDALAGGGHQKTDGSRQQHRGKGERAIQWRTS